MVIYPVTFSSHPPVYCTWTWFYWVKPPAFVYLCCCSLCVTLVLVVSMSMWFHFHACADWHHSRIYSLLWLPRGWDGKTCPWSQPGKSAMPIASFGTLFWIVDHQQFKWFLFNLSVILFLPHCCMCQGREDDNIETMQMRLKVFSDYSVPAMKYYESMGKVHKVLPLPSIMLVINSALN